MSITLQFDLGFHDFSADQESNSFKPGYSTPSAKVSIDLSDIRDGNETPSQDNQSSRTRQEPNDLMALMNFVALLMAILHQLLNAGANSNGQEQPDDDRIGGERPPASRAYARQPSGTEELPVEGKPKTEEVRNDSNQGNEGGQPPASEPQNPPAGNTDKSNPVTPKDGVSPNSSQLVSTGTGTGHYFNVTNNTDREQTFAFSSNSSNTSGYSNNINGMMTLKPGETGTFEAGDNVPGIRINTSGPNGETHGNEALYEDTIEPNPMGGGIVHNPDVSNVAGKLSYDGRPQRITVNDGTRTIGDGTETGVYDYDVEDTDPNRATNPMNMALNPASSYDIVFSDG